MPVARGYCDNVLFRSVGHGAKIGDARYCGTKLWFGVPMGAEVLGRGTYGMVVAAEFRKTHGGGVPGSRQARSAPDSQYRAQKSGVLPPYAHGVATHRTVTQCGGGSEGLTCYVHVHGWGVGSSGM
eukprot:519239-Rhodomonas_salina.1